MQLGDKKGEVKGVLEANAKKPNPEGFLSHIPIAKSRATKVMKKGK